MANISILSRLINGAQRNVDLSTNTLVVSIIKVGGGAGTDLTKTILDRLISLQNGTDVDASYHTHDGRYFTETELGSATSSSGSDLIGDDNTYTNFTPAAATVKGALSGIDTALASAGNEKLDSVFRIVDNGDITKKIAFEAAAISTGTVRTISMPDANVDLADANNAILKNGSRAFTANQSLGGFKLTSLAAGSTAGDSVRYEQAILVSGVNAWLANQSLGGFKITNAADGTANQDYVTKSQLDSVAAGLDPKKSVRAATTAALPAVTYNNGASGVGATLTANANGALAAQDGITLTVGQRFLVKNQAAALQNGIYTVTDAGSAGTPFILTRATDQDGSPASEVSGGNFTFVEAGTTQSGSGWSVVWDGDVVVGTDPLNWTQFSSIQFVGGDMVTVVGNTVSVDLAATSGLESSNPGNVAGQLRIKLEASNPSLRITGSNELAIKFDGAGALLSGASGVAVQVDNSSIEINSNALRLKDLGVTLAKLASNSVDENKIVSTTFSASGAITGGSGTKVAWNPDNSSLEISANAARIKSTAYDQNTITGGSGSAATVHHAPLAKRTCVAGEAFAANTSFVVRWALTGETAGRVYKADKDASVSAKYAAIGIALSTSAVSAGQNIDVVMLGEYSQGTSDTAFNAADVGLEVFVGASGAIILGAALANTANEAQFVIGSVQTTTKIWVDFKQLRGIA